MKPLQKNDKVQTVKDSDNLAIPVEYEHEFLSSVGEKRFLLFQSELDILIKKYVGWFITFQLWELMVLSLCLMTDKRKTGTNMLRQIRALFSTTTLILLEELNTRQHVIMNIVQLCIMVACFETVFIGSGLIIELLISITNAAIINFVCVLESKRDDEDLWV